MAPPESKAEKRASPLPPAITPRLQETAAKRRRRSRQSAAALPAAAPPPAVAPPPAAAADWREGWEEIWESEYSPEALRVIAERQQQRAAAAASAASAEVAARKGVEAPKERRLRLDAAALEGFTDAERRGLPHCMAKFRGKDAAGRRAYCDALLAVQEISDRTHPAKQSGLRQGRAHEWGVFARRPLVRGTLLGELTGLLCTGEEVDAAVAADPRGLGGLRADKIKSLSMTAPRAAAPRGDCGGSGGEAGQQGAHSAAAGWSQELVIDGGAKSCLLCFANCYEGLQPAPNVACVEAEEVASGTPHVFLVTLAPVEEGEELLLDYGPDFLRHIREEERRAAALAALERQVAALQGANAELQQAAARQKAHELLQDRVFLDLLGEYRALQQQQRRRQQEAEAAAAQLRQRLAGAEAALTAARAEASSTAQREAASLTQFCSASMKQEALLGAQMQAALAQAQEQVAAKDAELAQQRAAEEDARAALAAGQQQWEAERAQLAELLRVAQQQHEEVHRLLASGSLSLPSDAAAALDAATAAFDAAAAAAEGDEAEGEGVAEQEAAVEAAAGESAATDAATAGPGAAAAGNSQGVAAAENAADAEAGAGAAAGQGAGSGATSQGRQQEPQPIVLPGSPATPAAQALGCDAGALTAAVVARALAAQQEAELVQQEAELVQQEAELVQQEAEQVQQVLADVCFAVERAGASDPPAAQ